MPDLTRWLRPFAARRLKVVVDGIVYRFQKYGGINTYFNEVLARLSARPDISVALYYPRFHEGEPPRPVRLLRRELLPYRPGTDWRWLYCDATRMQQVNARLRRLRIRLGKPSVFHSTYFTRVGHGVTEVATAYDLNHELLPEWYSDDWGQWLRREYRQYLEGARRIIAISRKTRDDIVRFYDIDPGRIDVVYLAVNRARYWPDRDPAQRERLLAPAGLTGPYVLYVGNRDARFKNFQGLLTALASPDLNRELRLAIVGDPLNPSEIQQLGELGLTENVKLIRPPPDADLRTLYSQASALVYPSLHEGFGLPLIEAMACGTMVLASDIAVFREVAGDAALFFDPHNPADLTRALQISLDGSVRREYVERGFEQVSKYSWDRAAQQTYEVYRKATAEQAN